jgi:hypothetical protein
MLVLVEKKKSVRIVGGAEKKIFLFTEREEGKWVNMCWGSVSLGKA